MQAISPLEYALLGLLKQSPQSGYDLRKTFASTPLRSYSDSPGTVYPALRRLQSRKWITSSAKAGNSRNRQVFRLTRAGEAALLAWLRRPVTRDEVALHLGEVLLRFAFQSGNVDVGTTRAFLAQFENCLVNYVQELRDYARSSGLDKQDSTGALAFANGIEGYETQLKWARRAKLQFAGELR